MRSRRGFTIIELMLSLAITMILVAAGATRFHDASLRAKRSEAPTLADGILAAQLAYEGSHDNFLNISAWHPRTNVNKKPVAWTGGSAFDMLGWMPDGAVRCRYRAQVLARRVAVQGQCDVDDDNVRANFQRDFATHPARMDVALWTTANDVY